ncbi:TetR/AcrR family transcriptional regulator [Martelella sp. FOR1707]
MDRDLPNLEVRGKTARQARSIETKRRIVRAAIDIIAERDLADLTHRLVAERAGVGLAATTYYYKTKDDIVADVSNTLLNDYVSAFENYARRYRRTPRPVMGLRQLVCRLLCNAVSKNRADALCWMELLLESVRHPEDQAFRRLWAGRLEDVWAEIVTLHNGEDGGISARTVIDQIIGLQIVVLALGVDAQSIERVLLHGEDPLVAWSPSEAGHDPEGQRQAARLTPKARATRQRILDATVDILIRQGAGAVSYKRVAREAGLTPAAPAYYFSKPSELLREAQNALFEKSKERYRTVMTGVDFKALDLPRLVDLTAAVFLREVTEFGRYNLASYGIWLKAAREPELRVRVWEAIRDQGQAWTRIFSIMQVEQTSLAAFMAQFLFIGKHIRITCMGTATTDLAHVSQEFRRDLTALVEGRHWSLPENSTNKQKI